MQRNAKTEKFFFIASIPKKIKNNFNFLTEPRYQHKFIYKKETLHVTSRVEIISGSFGSLLLFYSKEFLSIISVRQGRTFSVFYLGKYSCLN